jgi:hypothetical protein
MMWLSSSVLLVAAQRDLFQAPALRPGFLASPVSSPEGVVYEPLSASYTPLVEAPAPQAPNSGFLATVSFVAICAVAGYGAANVLQARNAPAVPESLGSASALPRAGCAGPSATDGAADEAMRQVQDLIAEMTSSPATLKATLEKSSRVQAMAGQTPAVASALKDPAALAQEMKLLDAMHQLIGGMREALRDPRKRQLALDELRRLQLEAAAGPRAPSRAGSPVMQLSQLNTTTKKTLSFDREGVFEAREISSKKPPVKLLNRIQELRLLTTLADAGLLSKAEEAGLFSKLESAGAFSTAEKLLPLIDSLGVVGAAENLLNVPAFVQALGAIAILGGEIGVIALVPDDNAIEIGIQVVTGLLAGGGAVTLLASAFFFSLLQGEDST